MLDLSDLDSLLPSCPGFIPFNSTASNIMIAAAVSMKALPARAAFAQGSKKVSGSRQIQLARTSTVSQAAPVEVVQLANEAAFIGGVAGTMISMTLIGLAVGFVLLRFESLVEEGKL
eukprot:jgi/Ulvmu1/157/UM001_0161.1